MKDSASGQTFAQAFDAVATELQAGLPVQPQPWFEHQMPSAAQSAAGCAPGTTATACLASSFGGAFVTGQPANLWVTGIDIFRSLAGLQPINNLQFLSIGTLTSNGWSNYNALFATLRKRMSHGLSFDFNYTYSHSLDALGSVQNATTSLSNSFNPGLDYGTSSFDSTHVANLSLYYDLPFGHGRRWSPGGALDKVVGGWYVSSIYSAWSGLPLQVRENTGVFGGGIFNGDTGATRLTGSSFGSSSVHHGVAGSGGIGTAGDPATGGTGLNMFADPEAAFNSFRPLLLSQDTRVGRSTLRGLPHWNVDVSIGKETAITEKVKLIYSSDFFNILNHPQFNNPILDLQDPRDFGVLTSQYDFNPRLQSGARAIQMGLRLEF
jgi:hypothetical protein